jgi:hypothetical protein
MMMGEVYFPEDVHKNTARACVIANRFAIGFFVIFVLTCIFGIAYLFWKSGDPIIRNYELNGHVYKCEHYYDGTMNCFDRDDPEIGFGRERP